MYEVESTMKRIHNHRGVIGTIVINAEGIPTKTTLDNTSTVKYAKLLHALAHQARGVIRNLDPANDISFLRIRSKKNEILMAKDEEFILIVIQANK